MKSGAVTAFTPMWGFGKVVDHGDSEAWPGNQDPPLHCPPNTLFAVVIGNGAANLKNNF